MLIRNRPSLAVFATTAALVGAISAPSAFAQAMAGQHAGERATLLQGVASIHAPGGLVATLTLLDDSRAFTVVTGESAGGRAPIVAAAAAGSGRVVVYGHDNFLNKAGLSDSPGTTRLLQNAILWSAPGKTLQNVRVGFVGQDDALAWAKSVGIKAVAADPTNLSGIDVLVLNPDAIDGTANAPRIPAVQKWVREGHGLITYGVGWGWQQLHPGRALATAGFNRLLVPLAGIGCDGGTAEPTGKGGLFLCDGVGVDAPSAGAALTALERSTQPGATSVVPAQMGAYSRALTAALDVLPDDDTTFLPRLNALIANRGGAGPGGAVVPSRLTPVTQNEPIARLAAVLEARRRARLTAEETKADPAAISFPGMVPADAPRLTQTVSVDTSVPEWHSTGLYAAPGEVVTVTLPASAANKGLGVRIGAHKDGLWNVASWPRFPEITVEKRISGTALHIANAFGGTVYVTLAPPGGTVT